MLGLPPSTEMNRPLPKKLIYDKFGLNATAQERFDADISRLAIVHEVSPGTLPIQPGKETASFFIVRVILKTADFSEKNIELIARLINQNLLFGLEFEGRGRLAVWRNRLLKTSWEALDRLTLQLSGLDLDAIWQQVILQVGDITLAPGRGLDEQIKLNVEREALEKKIVKLEKLARAERQPKRKFELAQEMQNLRKEKANDKQD